MPLTPLSGEGIELPLSEYNRLRAFQGGGWFWDHENQQVIREVLGDFLPRVEERSRGTNGGAVAFYQHFVNGTEAAGKSEAVGAQMNRISRAEYQRLQTALEALKRKAENPHTDPNARRVIEKFCLPDPAKNPELYRLHGTGWNRRLLVLWGCEREPGTSLPPAAALHKISVEPPATALTRRLPLLLGLLLLLLLLAFAVYRYWPRHERKLPYDTIVPLTAQDPTLPSSGLPAPSPSSGAIAAPNGSPGSSDVPGASPSLATPATANPPSFGSGAYGLNGRMASPPTPPDANRATDSARQNGLTADPSTPANPAPSQIHTPRPDSAAANSPAPSPANPAAVGASPAASAATETSRDRRTNTSTATRERAASASSRQAAASPALSSASPSSGQSVDQASPSASPSSGLPSSSPAASMAPGQSSLADTPPASATSPAAPNTPPRLEILNASTSTPPRDGKMDLILMAAAHEADGTLAPLTVTQWSVDGTRQTDRAGQDVTASQLSLTLPPGKHRVNVSGTARGLPVETEAEVNVQIKSQGDVTVKPGSQK